ncbi:ureidoglycolate hydrolase [Hahella sp. CCB-MM4]|uniref:ureidoglycolate lyase n=1 Tax=Hahella sp. (strain CCB-MM4) TaxID=1926491 RepID=UPI000B9B53DD|nr:ureidoglycolate lyase [Hahella sp. CCB-MM4]OZG70138.1 ureidoglycolate hydrolase [Hahella sp. CCB-MM4]
MTGRVVTPQPLTREAFAPYGDVIEIHDQAKVLEINQGYTQRFHDLANVDVAAQGGRPLINIFRSTPLPSPLLLEVMERHPLSSQAFIPLNQRPYLVAVAAPGELDPREIQVFLAGPNQGVNYHKGTWHHFCLALDEVSDFLVVDRGGEGDNCDEVILSLDQVITINLED